jgi:hypothetical protein
MSEEVAEVLEKAADLIETVGHCKGNFSESDDQGNKLAYCALGAIAEAVDSMEASYSLRERTEDALERWLFGKLYLGQTGRSIPFWNDHRLRKPEQVVDALKQTAKDIRNTH